jgi:hypothetical protein
MAQLNIAVPDEDLKKFREWVWKKKEKSTGKFSLNAWAKNVLMEAYQKEV